MSRPSPPTLNRRDFLAAATTAVAATAAQRALRAAKRSADRPNIVFIMADDHALEAISCYGKLLKDHARTPNIDRIANEGMRFNNVCCNNSICSPSRASILTGQYSHANGVRGLGGKINAESPWVSVELKKRGYQTAVFGKWHLGSKPKGFDDYGVTKGQGKYFNPTFSTPRGTKKYQGYSTDVYTDVALKWLAARDKTKPFCLMLQFKAPHHPYDYADRHAGLLEGVNVPEPANLYEDLAKTSPLLKNKLFGQMDAARAYYGRHKDDTRPKMQPHDANDHRDRVRVAYQHMVKKYIRCITANDENVGRVLKALDDERLAHNTIVVYTADQGYWLGQHGLYDKRLILDESLKMPFLIRYPAAIGPGGVCDKLCSNVDFAPTLLDFSGAAVPKAMQGRSLRPLTAGKRPADWPTAIFYCYWAAPSHWGARTERYTLAHFPGTKEFEFYDLRTDPAQMVNQARNPRYARAIAETEKVLAALMKKIDFPTDNLPDGGKGFKQRKRKRGGKAPGRP